MSANKFYVIIISFILMFLWVKRNERRNNQFFCEIFYDNLRIVNTRHNIMLININEMRNQNYTIDYY